MNVYRLLLFIVFLAKIAIPAEATSDNAASIHIITLKHRPAETLIPMIQPLLPPNDVVTGKQYDLIIKTDERHFSEIQTLVARLDTPPVQLVISVKRSGSDDLSRQQKIITSTRTRERETSEEIQSLRLLDGTSAYINTGKSIPTLSIAGISTRQTSDQSNNNLQMAQQFQDIDSGFYVTPHVIGEQVELLLNDQQEQLDSKQDHQINRNNTSTRITVPLDQWTFVSGAQTDTSQNQNKTLTVTTRTQREHRGLYLKVHRLVDTHAEP